MSSSKQNVAKTRLLVKQAVFTVGKVTKTSWTPPTNLTEIKWRKAGVTLRLPKLVISGGLVIGGITEGPTGIAPKSAANSA
jgi:hypothetical protein